MTEKPLAGTGMSVQFGPLSMQSTVNRPFGTGSGVLTAVDEKSEGALPSGPTARPRSRMQDMRSAYRCWVLRRKSAKQPDTASILNELGAIYELQGQRELAAECYTSLALLARRKKDAREMAIYCRKLEMLGCPHRAKVYREIAMLYCELGDHESTAQSVTKVVDLYMAAGHTSAAAGYLKTLPAMGPIDKTTRAELERVVGQRPVPRPPSTPLPLQSKPSSGPLDFAGSIERSWDDMSTILDTYGGEVFLSGVLGRISPFDIVQMIEANSLTGRLDVTTAAEFGIVFFKNGRIVASRYGTLSGVEAARKVLTIEHAPFRVVVTDMVPPDEFDLPNNTGFLLEILRVADEESADRETSDEDLAKAFATSPLSDPFLSHLD